MAHRRLDDASRNHLDRRYGYREGLRWASKAVVVGAGAFIGGVAVLGAFWWMFAHYDKTNRQEHAALMEAIRGLGERMATVEGKLDLLIAQRKS